tara:strand:- start:175 stop:675 length:501 start_codon:yes stop_codon:yes gene_type:complete
MQELTAKQSKFVELFLTNGENRSKAYRDSGYKCSTEQTAYVGGSKLLSNGKVLDRILAIKADSIAKKHNQAKRINIDEQWLLAEYIDTIQLAKDDKQYNVVKASLDSIARMTGHLISKTELQVSGEVSHLASLDTQSLMNALTQAQQPEAIEAEFSVIDSDETGTI